MRQNKYEYDAFISHAVEDKIPIANELCARLERAGLRIWYSGKELGIGDSIEKTIERGLNRSRYGIVIFSPTYLAKNWTIREFYTLLAKEIEEQKVILPVLYNITLDELKNKDLVMADRFAVNSDKGMDFVVDRLVREIKRRPVAKKREAWFSRMWVGLFLSLFANLLFLFKETVFNPVVDPSVSVLHSRNLVQDPQRTPGLFREARNVTGGLNACSCCRDNDQPVVVKAGFTPPGEFSEARVHAIRQSEEPAHYTQRPAGRMTMAVVFQVDAPDRVAEEFGNEMEAILTAFSRDGRNDPFETTSIRSNREAIPSQTCSHFSHLKN